MVDFTQFSPGEWEYIQSLLNAGYSITLIGQQTEYGYRIFWYFEDDSENIKSQTYTGRLSKEDL